MFMMIDKLKEKIMQPQPLLDEEIEFMLEHLGDENPRIRDELIYGLFCISFETEMISKEQMKGIIKHLFQQNVLLQDIEHLDIDTTLTRSYGALLWALILFYDNEKTSLYYKILLRKEREKLFELALYHIANEKDHTGYLKPYGWIHTIAHASELLLAMVKHQDMRKDVVNLMLRGIYKMFIKQKEIFRDKEEKRIGLVIVEMLKRKQVSMSQLINWIDQLQEHYATDHLLEVKDFRSKENVVNMLNYMVLFMEEDALLKERIKAFNRI